MQRSPHRLDRVVGSAPTSVDRAASLVQPHTAQIPTCGGDRVGRDPRLYKWEQMANVVAERIKDGT
ncbi:hypothetical protein GCM10010412_069580 [Nonomuraea recticatena]|uniref:Uncharacterized protein n=1 Tax=Nonomuraea recticatena TaxID=46178 RepID=A0ABP6FA81_9ACTN